MNDKEFETRIEKVKHGDKPTWGLFMELYRRYQGLLAEYRTAIAANKAWAKRAEQ